MSDRSAIWLKSYLAEELIMNQVLENIYERRSVRAFTDQGVSETDIREIIKAGFHAPNGSNTQGLRFAVVTNKETIRRYSNLGRTASLDIFSKLNAKEPSESLARIIKTLSNPDNDIFHDAPVLVFVFASPSCVTPAEDGSLAAENMMLAACSLGLGSCWIGFGKPLMYNPEVMKELNMPADHQLIASLTIGYPKKTEMRPSSRQEPTITAWLN